MLRCKNDPLHSRAVTSHVSVPRVISKKCVWIEFCVYSSLTRLHWVQRRALLPSCLWLVDWLKRIMGHFWTLQERCCLGEPDHHSNEKDDYKHYWLILWLFSLWSTSTMQRWIYQWLRVHSIKSWSTSSLLLEIMHI